MHLARTDYSCSAACRILARMNNYSRLAALVVIVSLLPGCSQPPVGFYETRCHDAVEYVRRDGRPLRMDIFVPQDGRSARPAVVIFHGGGWAVGNRGYNRDMARFLASMGYTAATADYRLWPDGGVHPAPVQDALAAVKFLRKNHAEYGVDSCCIAVAGESAGGHLALLVGLAQNRSIFGDDAYPDVDTSVSAVIDIYGPTDVLPMYERGGWLVRRLCRGYAGCRPEENPEQWKQLSPVSHAWPGAPPVLIVHGERDSVVPFSQATAMAEALKKAGSPYELVMVPGAGHGWGLSFDGVASQRTLPVIVDFLARVFKDHRLAPGARLTDSPRTAANH